MKAYPFSHRHPTTGVTTSSEGMDLRDHFAGLAMQGMISSGNLPVSVSDEEIADAAYEMADLMLKERNK